MRSNFLKKGLSLLLARQTSILSAAFVIMATVILSQVLGLVRQRLLLSLLGVSSTGLYLVASQLPDSFFQLIIAAAVSTAFIPVFTDYLSHNQEEEGHKMASTLLVLGFIVFTLIGGALALFAPQFLQLFNIGSGYNAAQVATMASLMRIIVLGQLLFIIATFFSVILQSYNHFFIPGFAAALFNLGIIIGIVTLTHPLGIYAPAVGNIIGALLFILVQLPMMKRVGFRFIPQYTWTHPGVLKVAKLMWPRTLSIAVSQIGTIATVSLVSFLAMPGRNYTLLDCARTLAFAPVVLFGQTIAQAAFPILSREKDKPDEFRSTFMTSFNQMLYLILPIAVLILVLRIPIVRLIYGTARFDWPATVLTGRTLAYFALSIVAQSLINLVSRAFYALHNTKTPFSIGTITTLLMLVLSGVSIYVYRVIVPQLTFPYAFFGGLMRGEFVISFGIEGIAFAYSLASLVQLVLLMVFLSRKIAGFQTRIFIPSILKICLASVCTIVALYIPLKLLDRLVFDTTKTVNLLMLTGISSAIGLSLYLFLTWFLNVKEARTFLLIFRRVGNWREILTSSDEVLNSRLKP